MMKKLRLSESPGPTLYVTGIAGLLCVSGCSERTSSYVYTLDSYDVSWEDGDDALEDELAQIFEDSDEFLVLELKEVRKGLGLDRQECKLWRARDDGAGGLDVFALAGSTQEASLSVKSADELRYDAFLGVDELVFGDVTMETPYGIWLTGQIIDGAFEFGYLSFDQPEVWEPGSLVDDVLEAMVEDILDFEGSVELGFEEGPINVHGINFQIQHTGAYVPDP